MLPPEFELRTVQPVTSRYTDCTIPAPSLYQLHYTNSFAMHGAYLWSSGTSVLYIGCIAPICGEAVRLSYI